MPLLVLLGLLINKEFAINSPIMTVCHGKKMSNIKLIPFNSPLEIGVRTLTILIVSYPKAHDLNRLVQYDYLTVHSLEDAGGPQSLHPPYYSFSLSQGELLVAAQSHRSWFTIND